MPNGDLREEGAGDELVNVPGLVALQFSLSTSEARRLHAWRQVWIGSRRLGPGDLALPKRELDGQEISVGTNRRARIEFPTGPDQHEQPRCGGSGKIPTWTDGYFHAEQQYEDCPGCIDCQPCERCGGSGDRVDRVGVHEYEFGGGPCPDCNGTGKRQPETPGLQEGSGPIVHIARCPEHGLHGARDTCFECGREVEQVPMVAVADPIPGCGGEPGKPRYVSLPEPPGVDFLPQYQCTGCPDCKPEIFATTRSTQPSPIEVAAREFDRRAEEKFNTDRTKQGCCYANAAAYLRQLEKETDRG